MDNVVRVNSIVNEFISDAFPQTVVFKINFAILDPCEEYKVLDMRARKWELFYVPA